MINAFNEPTHTDAHFDVRMLVEAMRFLCPPGALAADEESALRTHLFAHHRVEKQIATPNGFGLLCLSVSACHILDNFEQFVVRVVREITGFRVGARSARNGF